MQRTLDRLLGWLTFRLPARLVYRCAIRVWAETTSGPYGSTVASELTASDAVARFARIHALGGAGSDEHFDSNRKEFPRG